MDNLKEKKLFKYITPEEFKKLYDKTGGMTGWKKHEGQHGMHQNVRFKGYFKNGDSYVFTDEKETVAFCITRRFLKKIINEC